MAQIAWDAIGEKFYETGVDHCVLYQQQNDGSYGNGVAWNGVSSISESSDGGEPSPVYADNIQYLNLFSTEKTKLSIEAYTYPDEFAECDGSAELTTGVKIAQQTRKQFGLSYRTQIGNDTQNTDYGYKLHLVYNCLAAPTERGYETVDDDAEAITFSWDVSTTPVSVTGHKPTALLTVDSSKVGNAKMAKLEAALYGTSDAEPYLPLPDKVLEILNSVSSDDDGEGGDTPNGEGGDTPNGEGGDTPNGEGGDTPEGEGGE